MPSIQQDMDNFRKHLKEGSIQRAYRSLISFMMSLRTHFVNEFGEANVSGLYQGFMDMTYFALYPPTLNTRELKIAIVFNYQAFRLEVWLAARNRKVQKQYWELLKDCQWPEYRIVSPAAGIDSIVECSLTEDFNIIDPEMLISKIEGTTAEFIKNIAGFLNEHNSRAGAL